MIKNIAAAAALALSSALLTCAPAQAAPHSFPLPPFGYYALAPAPLGWQAAPLLVHPGYVVYTVR
ncbi:hypothetical protein [Streptomyces sp. RerS4]|uniref:hypothetical protein n=1 Tax=Streptomyces sp. RerS4 TaxID=2942449 RepID=UPI00201C6136|nr:hypothetical protein [Streptomyces sp. RerS4]UQX02122.1 hypothetical protein M4D82_17670 [Streptomyces sp. RerS4]